MPSTFAPSEIFKAYDIRGIVERALTPEAVENIGHAIGSEAIARKQTEVAIGRDGRGSGPELSAALARGLRASGINVVDVGMVATPMVYFTMPTSITSMPAARRPRASAADNSGPDSRPSRPMATWVCLRATASEPMA